MNYTEKYHLPKWEKSDRVMMDDFNEMCKNLDEGIAQAQETAETAQATADNAQKTALTYKNYVVGSYTGADGAQTINVGFSPSAVLICYRNIGTNASFGIGMISLHMRGMFSAVTMKDSGFEVSYQSSISSPNVNVKDCHYGYIAFR